MANNVKEMAEKIVETFNGVPDLVVRELKTEFFFGILISLDGFNDTKELEDGIVKPLIMKNNNFQTDSDGLKSVITFAGNIKEKTFEECEKSILNGSVVLITSETILEISARKNTGRSVEEPPTFSVIKGPREGFVENVKTNCVLIRRRIKSASLVFKELSVGKTTETKVVIAYLKGTADEKIAEEAEERIKRYEIDGILDSSYLTKMLEDKPYSLFKQIGNSEKPDIVVGKLLEGKIAILCDGSPIVLYIPFTLIEDFEDVQDLYKRPVRATFLRYMRFTAVFLALLAPGLFVALQVYQFEILPLELMITVVKSTGNIPFSPTIEMLIALIFFEILGEASIRMPRHVGMALGVVGAIVLGETAVKAGVLSSLTVLVVAMSGIGLYAVPDEAGTLGTLRVVFVICGGLVGILGILFAGLSVLAYLAELNGFGVPYLLPIAPIFKEDLKDVLFKYNITDLKYRTASFGLKNKIRLRKVK